MNLESPASVYEGEKPVAMDVNADEVTIVFVNGDEHIAELTKSLFPEEVSIIVALTPEIAEQLIQKNNVDLIVIDTQFCKGEGIGLCKTLKESARLASVPIIITSPKRDKIEEEVALLVGAADYFESDLSTMAFYMRLKKHVEHIQQIRALENASREDGLTGLANRKHLEQTITKEWHNAIRGEHPISFLLFDIDQFTLYNNFYGYQNGDECLRQITSALQKSVSRVEDTIARYDADEFIAILPRADFDGAKEVAQHIGNEVQNLRLKHADDAKNDILTLCTGGVTFQPSMESTDVRVESIIDQLRAHLQEAKASGCGQHRVSAI